MFEKSTAFANWMSWFSHENRDEPFRLPDGRRCTTNGRWAMVAQNDGPVCEGDKFANRGKVIAGHLEAEAIHEREVSREFMEQFGPCNHPEIGVCQTCEGRGDVPHVCGCDLCEEDTELCGECDGKGKSINQPDQRKVTLWGHPFSANMIAYMVEHAPAATGYRLRVTPNVLVIATDQWEGVVVRLHPGSSTESVAEIMTQQEVG